MLPFGQLLRQFRRKCRTPLLPDRILSQETLGELIGAEMGMKGGYSGAAVSDWELGKSKIQADQRYLLISLVKTLRERGGITTLSQANELLASGNYRNLDIEEIQKIFPDIPDTKNFPVYGAESPTGEKKLNVFFEYFLSPLAIEQLPEPTGKAVLPAPLWPHLLTASIRKLTLNWSIARFGRMLAWLWVLILNYATVVPLLRWPFGTLNDIYMAVVLYLIASITIPLVVGALSDTKHDEFWNNQGLAQSLITRLYIHQGAHVGYHVSYFPIFFIFLICYYLHIQFLPWFEFLLIALIPLGSYLGSQMVPYNLWRAFGRLSLADGSIFFVFVLIGPFWGLAFLFAYPVMFDLRYGPIIIISALTILTVTLVWHFKRMGSTIIKTHWWVAFFGSVALLYQISNAKNIFSIASFVGILFAFGALIAIQRIQVKLGGLLSLLMALWALGLLFQINLIVGCIFGALLILIWSYWGKRYFSLPSVFFGVIIANVVFFLLARNQWLFEWQAAILFVLTSIFLVLWDYKRSKDHIYSGE